MPRWAGRSCSWPVRPPSTARGASSATVVAQFDRRWATCSPRCAAAGGRPADLASLTIYVVDIDDYRATRSEIGAVWRRLVGARYPAMAAVGVARLWDADALVEVQGFAVLRRAGHRRYAEPHTGIVILGKSHMAAAPRKVRPCR